MWAKHKNQSGFTIVELLIVIVVIGILAAVTIVAYNGVQQRARNAQTSSAVSQYLKLFKVYIADGNSYPTLPAGYSYACLGEDYPSDLCWNGGATEVASINTLLKSQGNNLPMPGLISQGYSGIIYAPASTGWKLDGQAVNWVIYAIDGKTTTTRCPVGQVASYVGSPTIYDFSSTSPASGQSQAGTASQNPTCWIPLT